MRLSRRLSGKVGHIKHSLERTCCKQIEECVGNGGSCGMEQEGESSWMPRKVNLHFFVGHSKYTQTLVGNRRNQMSFFFSHERNLPTV